MANFRLLLLLALAIALHSSSICAQDLPLIRFNYLLEEAGLDYLAPTDAGYREIRSIKNSFQRTDFAIHSRQENLEIRFLVKPLRDTLEPAPHMNAMTLVTHLATNDEDASIAVHSIPATPYQADWSKAFFFQPKRSVSERKHCKMIAIYKEGRGMAFVFYFFDEADAALDSREVLLQYLE